MELKLPDKSLGPLVLLSMMYITSLLLTAVLVHKMVAIGPFNFSAGTFVFPFSYFFGDVIAEVFGYRISRQLIWAAFLCMFLFDMGSALLTFTEAPTYWHDQKAYERVLGPLPRIFLGDFVAMNAGAFINAYLISKTKIVTRGKHFCIRSLISTTVGEAVFTVLAFLIMFVGEMSFTHVLQIIAMSYSFKVIYALIAVYPALLLTHFLKNKCGVDVYDYQTNFSPFRLSLS